MRWYDLIMADDSCDCTRHNPVHYCIGLVRRVLVYEVLKAYYLSVTNSSSNEVRLYTVYVRFTDTDWTGDATDNFLLNV